MDDTTTETLSGESLVQNHCFFLHNFLFSCAQTATTEADWYPVAVVGLGGRSFKILQRKNMQQNHRQLFLFRHNREALETIRNWSVTKQQGTAVGKCCQNSLQSFTGCKSTSHLFLLFFLSFLWYYSIVSFLIASESFPCRMSLSSCSSLKSDIRIMWHPCHLGNQFPSDTSQRSDLSFILEFRHPSSKNNDFQK